MAVCVPKSALPSDKWDLVDLPWADDGSVTDWFIEHERDRYGWFDLLTGQILGMQRDHRVRFARKPAPRRAWRADRRA